MIMLQLFILRGLREASYWRLLQIFVCVSALVDELNVPEKLHSTSPVEVCYGYMFCTFV
jgi:hypothetical protein